MTIETGIYEHYKGKHYFVIGLARDTETDAENVAYRSLYGGGELWVRPREMFEESVTLGSRPTPRFKLVKAVDDAQSRALLMFEPITSPRIHALITSPQP